MKKIALLVGALLLSACSSQKSTISTTPDVALPQGVSFVETQHPTAGKAEIPYSKYRLDNGLTVILSPDHSDPLVHVDVTYHVGSAREKIGRSGFAHFFEHMMFQGSEHVGDQQHFKIVTEAGGSLNGTTNRDRTNYFETVPSNQLEKMLWLESDRMGFLVNAVSQRKFEIQRDTVKNERGQNYDNRPYGLVYERIGEALYPQTHPYAWQTIGYVSDLDRVDVNDLKAFFLRWYGPNNAVLTIGGDIDKEQTLQWVNKYFGSVPKGPAVVDAAKQPVTLPSDRFITLQDRIRQPMLMMAFPTKYRGDKSEASVDALASILGDGKNSILYQKLVKPQKAIDAGAFQDCGELSCTLYIYAMGDAGDKGNLKPIYDDVMNILSEFKTDGVKQDQLDAIMGQAEAGTVYALQSVSGKVSQLAANQTYYDQPDRLQLELEQLRQVTPDSVMKVFNQFVADKPKVALSVVPKGKTDLAARPVNFTPEKRELPVYPKITDAQLDVREPKDNFDRSIMPATTAAVSATMPSLYQFDLANGVPVLGTVSSETPTVVIKVDFPAGNRYVNLGQEGLAGLTADMLGEGTTLHTSEALQQELDKLGSSISFSAGTEHASLIITSLSKNVQATLDLANEMLFKPAFNDSDFARLKNQTLQSLIYSHQKPSWAASQATRDVLYKGSLYSRDNEGSLASINSITLDQVKQFYQTHYAVKNANVIVVGDRTQDQMKQDLAFLSRVAGTPSQTAPMKPAAGKYSEPSKQSIYLVDQPNAPQSIIRLVRTGMTFDATGDLFLTQLANYNLAGNFNSRINQNLREDKGFTYGASGGAYGGKETGVIVFSAQVRADSTGASIHEFIKEMQHYSKDGMTEPELDFMRLAVGQQDALNYETPAQKAGLLSTMVDYSLQPDFIAKQAHLVSSVSLNTLNKQAAQWFNPKDYQIIVVGDVKTIEPQLKKLGIAIKKLEVSR
ncbi:insulinase family protein [Vibrio sp. S11_S32]|uniref:M16 family metallopeptidase n=1 Tax=Vibrio sp. S11_S32 TaxID=2720225 RepID=UPI0016802D60|nr:pitrilysin family protein [Vibrio sp. S11_S32]MBD1576076.1 insulinase family protein [Vibrio sp. S11_S32]